MMPLADDRAATACIELQSPEQDLPDYCINICTILDDSGHMTTALVVLWYDDGPHLIILLLWRALQTEERPTRVAYDLPIGTHF